MRYSVAERVELVTLYSQPQNSVDDVCRIFFRKHPTKPKPSKTAVLKLFRKFMRSGSVADDHRSGRKKTSTGPEQQQLVVEAFRRNPRQSLAEVSLATGVEKTSVYRLAKLHHFHPYKIQLHQQLRPDDPSRRLTFCELILGELEEDPSLVDRILFSDECTFYINGEVNRHNCRYWCEQNPHVMHESHQQTTSKVNLWCGIIGNSIIGPFVLEGNLNSEKYLQLLQDEVGPALTEVVGAVEVVFQQDGAPAHFGMAVREYLDNTFEDSWIGRGGSIEWPPRSPDLTPLDFFLWGHLKTMVFATPPQTLEELERRIRVECTRITPNHLQNVRDCFVNRLVHCIGADGLHFEHVL